MKKNKNYLTNKIYVIITFISLTLLTLSPILSLEWLCVPTVYLWYLHNHNYKAIAKT